MKFSKLGLWFLVFGILFVGGAFGSGQTETEGDAEDEIVVLSFLGPESPSTMQPVIDAFEAQNDSVRVEYEQVPFNDLNDVIQSRMGRGDSNPDVYTADQPRIPGLVDRGFLLDVSEFRQEMEDTLFAGSIEASSSNGGIYAFPQSTSSQLLFYNKKHLDAAGIDYPGYEPSDRLTWAELVELAEQAQGAGADWGFILNQVNRIYQVQPLPESLGGGPGLKGDEMLTPDLTNDAWIEALSFYRDLFADGISPRGVPTPQTPDLFANGELAFFLAGPWWLPRFTATDGLEFGVSLHPYFEDGVPATPTDGWSWGINPNSEHIDEAKQFLRFATLTEEGAQAMAENFPLVPVHTGVFDGYYEAKYDIDGVGPIIQYELENTVVHRARSVGFIQFETVLLAAFEDIRNGADVEDTLARAEEELNSAFSRLR